MAFSTSAIPPPSTLSNAHEKDPMLALNGLWFPKYQMTPDIDFYMVQRGAPSVMEEITQVPLLGQDTVRYYAAEFAVVVPGKIDVPRFIEAIKKTLYYFPTYAGRFRTDHKTDDRWIELNDAGVPLVVDNDCQLTPLSSTNWTVVGDNLAGHVHPINIAYLENTDEPAASLKLNYYKSRNETAIATVSSHQLADVTVGAMFFFALSDFYKGMEKLDPEPMLFINRGVPPPESIEPEDLDMLFESLMQDPRWKTDTYMAHQAYEVVKSDVERGDFVNFQISPQQAEKLKAFAKRDQDPTLRISKADVVTAFIVTLLNKVYEVPILHVRSTWDYRYLAEIGTYGNNGVTLAMSEMLDEEDKLDIGKFAASIRDASNSARDPQAFKLMQALQYTHFARLKGSGRYMGSKLGEGIFVSNSVLQLDFSYADFGFGPNTMRNYSTQRACRFLRLQPSNPVIRDGKVIDSRTGYMDAHVRIEKEHCAKFEALVKQSMKQIDEMHLTSPQPSAQSARL